MCSCLVAAEGIMHSSSTEKFDPVTTMVVSDEGPKKRMNHDHVSKEKRRPYFDWIQLIATIWIPIAIAIYTIVENKSNESIAESNRLKDTQLANISRASELEIALANRLNELTIAEQSRQKDRDLAMDHQHQTILGEYQSFLAKSIIEHGVALNKPAQAKVAVHFMTFMALKQLDTKRRGILLRSLYDAKLITLARTAPSSSSSTVDLQQADLAAIQFGLLPEIGETLPRTRYIIWQDLWLPNTILTNATFRHTVLDGASFSGSDMSSADLSFSSHMVLRSSKIRLTNEIDFSVTSLVNASFYKATLKYTDFTAANLTWANMHGIECRHCTFSWATLFQADLSSSKIFSSRLSPLERLDCKNANFSRAIVHSAHYGEINLDHSDWSQVEASRISVLNCTFIAAKMENASFTNSVINWSEFRNASLYATDLSHARMRNVSFVNADMRKTNLRNVICSSCTFTNANLHGAMLKNASFLYSNFYNSLVTDAQLAEVADLAESILPNGTLVGSRNP